VEGIIKGGGAALTALLAIYVPQMTQTLLLLLLVLSIADFVTGFLAACLTRQVDSQVGFRGVTRKAMMFFMVLIVSITETFFHQLTGIQPSTSVSLGDTLFKVSFSSATAAWYCIQETVSIMENARKIGVLPPLLEKILKVIESK